MLEDGRSVGRANILSILTESKVREWFQWILQNIHLQKDIWKRTKRNFKIDFTSLKLERTGTSFGTHEILTCLKLIPRLLHLMFRQNPILRWMRETTTV